MATRTVEAFRSSRPAWAARLPSWYLGRRGGSEGGWERGLEMEEEVGMTGGSREREGKRN